MRFTEAEPNKTYTVKRIKGREIAKKLEEMGIAVGSDIVILPAEGTIVRLVNGRELPLGAAEADALTLEYTGD